MSALAQDKYDNPLPKDSRMVMAQVGWLGGSGCVYALDDPPYGGREPASFSPLYISLGVWEYSGNGHYGIKD